VISLALVDDDNYFAILKCFGYSFCNEDVKVLYFHMNGKYLFYRRANLKMSADNTAGTKSITFQQSVNI